MLAIKITFPAGRYHATPWGRHVNEGAVEWPPSPWRIVRALLSVWYHKCPDISKEAVRNLAERLANPPQYYVPPAIGSHVRHYMPLDKPGSSAKIFDTFVATRKEIGSAAKPEDALWIIWSDVELNEAQAETARELFRNLGYLGRAESWICAEVSDTSDVKPNVFRISEGVPFHEPTEPVRLLAPVTPEEYADWSATARADQAKTVLADKVAKAEAKGKPTDKIKLSKKDQEKIAGLIPGDLFEALHADTDKLRADGWSRPPGSRWIDYAVPKDYLTLKPVSHTKPVVSRSHPTTARYAVIGSVWPLFTRSLAFAEQVRSVAMGFSRRIERDENASQLFSGKIAENSPLRCDHQHAHFLPESLDETGYITHLTVHAPGGFGETECRVLRSIVDADAAAWLKGGHKLRLILLGLGMAEDLALPDAVSDMRITGKSCRWRSRTPFIPPRHLKIKRSERRDPKHYAEAIRRELVKSVRFELKTRPWQAEFAETVEVRPILDRDKWGTQCGSRFFSWAKFLRERKNGHGAQGGRPAGFELVFPRPVQGPIALGYACHFGLGQFVPVR